MLILSVAGYLGVQFLPLHSAPSLPQESFSRAPGTHTFELSPAGTQNKFHPDATSRVYVDPETGQFRKPPGGAVLPEAAPPVVEDMARKSAMDEPQEFMSPMAGGGVITKVRLRFRRPLMATKDADGNLKIQHVPQEADLHGQQ